jgi:hypothetical protein
MAAVHKDPMPSTRSNGSELAVMGARLPLRNVVDSTTARPNESFAIESVAIAGAITPAAESTQVRMLVTDAAVMLSERARCSATTAAFTESFALCGGINVVN